MECFWCSLDHIIYCNSTKDKIMQITFLLNDLAFLPFSCSSIAIIAVFRENCLACFFDGVIFPENHGNLRGIKSPAMQLGWDCTWQPIVKYAKWKFDAANGHIITILFPLCEVGGASKLLSVLREANASKKGSVICKWICPRFSQIFLVTEVHLGTSQWCVLIKIDKE